MPLALPKLYAFAVLATSATLASAGDDQQSLAPDKPDKPDAALADNSSVQIKDELRSLRVCNAYTAAPGLDVFFLRTGKSLGHMAYKSCKDFELPLKKGDHIDFEIPASVKSNLTDVGKFAVSEIPVGSGALLLVVRRADGKTTPAKFMSHAFAVVDGSGGQAQIAVIDAFQGDLKDSRKLKIMDADSNGTDAEDLPTNSALALSPGKYKIGLDKKDLASFSILDAKANTSYVVMRVGAGVEVADNSSEFGEDLVVFPKQDVKSGANGVYGHVWSVFLLVLARFVF
jgi:hypothetical protein